MTAILESGTLTICHDGRGGMILFHAPDKSIRRFFERDGEVAESSYVSAPAEPYKPLPPIAPTPASEEWHRAKMKHKAAPKSP